MKWKLCSKQEGELNSRQKDNKNKGNIFVEFTKHMTEDSYNTKNKIMGYRLSIFLIILIAILVITIIVLIEMNGLPIIKIPNIFTL